MECPSKALALGIRGHTVCCAQALAAEQPRVGLNADSRAS